MKLLIADDEEFSRTCISEMLDWNSYGITVVATAENGLDAWEKVKKYKPDIVITDIKMPQISGLDLLAKIQENHLEIDTIMISGFDEFAFAQKALNLGAKNYLLKPVNPAELLNSVITLQDQKNQERRNKFDGDKEGNLRNMIYLSYTPEELDEIHDQMLECWDYFQAILLLQMDNISDALYIGETNIYKILLQEIDLFCHDTGSYLLEKSPHNMLFYVLAKSTEEIEEKISLLLDTIQTILQNVTYDDYTVGVSKINHGIEESAKSYLEARRAANMKYVCGNGNIYYAAEEKTDSRVEESDCIDLIREIVENTVYFKEEEVDLLLDRLMSQKRFSGIEELRQNVYMIVTGIIRSEALVNIDINSLYPDTSLIIISICNCGDPFEMHRKMKAFLHTIGRKLNEIKIKKPNQIIERIKRYIEENYQIPEMRLSLIAEKFNFSPAYLSALFKNSCNQNITDYINAVRIEAACRYLIQNEYKISHISELVGYANVTYFYKVFKNLKGCSPRDYLGKYWEGET